MASGSPESKEEIHLFSGKESPLHPHHKAEFKVDGVKYNFIEQYVLYKKAELCKATKNTAELMKITDPNQLRQFEKKFIIANHDSWETKLKEFTQKGYLEKSRQVKDLFNLLRDTKGKSLAYATRKDSVLGIGVDANDPLSRRKSNWKGKNLLGEWLMEVREQLPDQLEASSLDGIASKQYATDGSPQHKESVKDKESNVAEKFTFFWQKESPFSQWHPSSFVIDDQCYNCAEQYMMHQKAVTYGDHLSAEKILKSKDPMEQKELGRSAANFSDNKQWSLVSMEIVRKGNLAKFGQNEKLKELLFETVGTTLVEASPYDKKWGIGLEGHDPKAKDRKQWLGKNQLGQVLTEVREELMRREREDFPSKGGEKSLGARQKDDAESYGPEKFTFFWRTESPFSQWHPCTFVIDDQWYNCAEQYMMHQKAVTFGDHLSVEKILRSKDPMEQKRLGRMVANFNDKQWDPVSMEVVRKGNLAKFGQSEKLKGILFDTAGTTLVEASPKDRIWGIGLEGHDPRANDRSKWLGKNQLGQVLTEVREELMRREREGFPSKGGEKSLGVRGKDDAGKPAKRKADGIGLGQERKTTEGGTDAKVPKGRDLNVLNKETDQRKSDSLDGKNKRGETQKQNSAKRSDKKVKEENNDVQMSSEVENLHGEMSNAEHVKQDHLQINSRDKTKKIIDPGSLSKSCNETPMEYTDANLHSGKDEAWDVADPSWEGLNAMELDIEDNSEGKKKRERSKDDHRGKDKGWTPKKEKTGYNYQAKLEAGSKFDDQASPEKFTFFWRADSPFSQHHPANFVIDGIQYNCAEQFMMHQKAVVFRDDRIGYEIMHTVSPAKQKGLAKQIEGFDDVHWKTLRRDVVKKGNIAKFSQNPRLRRMLFATAGTTMVEASPVDNTWGIGLSADDPKAWRRSTWAGGNLLGEILSEVRDELMGGCQTLLVEEEEKGSYRKSDRCDEQFTIFWRPVSPFHPRYPMGFVLDNQYYQTLQQYLLHQKALFFNDSLTARQSLEYVRPNKLDELGRNIRDYDHRVWSRHCRSYLRLGNFAKFSQNPNIGQQLIDNVQNGELVFAGDEDRLLGVGLKEEDGRLFRKESWKGKNLLGQALMEVREMLIKNVQALPEIFEDPEDEDIIKDVPEFRVRFFFNDPPFSQWRPSRFSIRGVQYTHAEQYMIHQMALHFRDKEAADAVMRCRHPAEMQRIDIRDYNQREWEEVCKDIVMEGNRTKFMQDHRAREDLLKSEDLVLAYAAVNDTVLGIGLRDSDPRAYDPQNWPGQNVLGSVLMEIRDELKKQKNSSSNNNSSKRRQSESQESQTDEKFTFFWQRSPFSQWWMCDIRIDGAVYNCSEQYMMHKKALFFNDQQTAKEIMATQLPLDQLKLGRRIQGYDYDKWNAVCVDIVRTGNMEKFSQHPRMKQKLFETAGTTLVEASPKDCKWGIGLTESDHRAKRRDTWMGRNLLGQILTEVRDKLMKQENSDPQAHSAGNIPGSGLGRDRRGSERSDNSRGHRKDSESNSKGSTHESHQKSKPDQGGEAGSQHRGAGNQYREAGGQQRGAGNQYREAGGQQRGAGNQYREAGGQQRGAGNQYREAGGQQRGAGNQCREAESQQRETGSHLREAGNQYRDTGNQHRDTRNQHREAAGNQRHDRNPNYRQNPKSDRVDAGGRTLDERHDEGNERFQPHSRSFHGERPHAVESRHHRDGDRRQMDSPSDQHKSMEKQQHRATEESRSVPSGHSGRTVSQKSRSNPNGQLHRPANQDLHSERSRAPPAQSGNAHSLPGADTNADSRVDGDAVSNENVHIISEGAVLSLWHQANFKVDKMKYKSVGQYISHQKALLFNDGMTADDIMKASSAGRIIKCDKYIDEFDEKKWNRVYKDVVKDGCYFKFSQNEALKQELMATSGSLLIYAADVKDLKFGVGLKSDDRGIRDRKRWRGENVLGFVLMEVRDDLIHGRDSTSKMSRDQGSASEAHRNAPAEIIEEDTKKDVQEQTPDGDVKTVTSEDKISLDTGNLGATDPSSAQDKGELQKDAEVVAMTPSEECEKDNVNELKKTESLQETAVPEKISLKDSVTPEKVSLQETAVPNESTSGPIFSENNQSGPMGAIKVVGHPSSFKVLHKAKAAELHSEQTALMIDEETEVKSAQMTAEAAQTVLESSHDDTENDKTTPTSETPASSATDEIFVTVPHSEAVHTDSECVTKKDVEETNTDMKDSARAGIPELGLKSKSRPTANNDKAASDETVTSDATLQNQAYDGQKREDTQAAEPQELATDTLLGTKNVENNAEPGAEKQGKTGEFATDSSANNVSHEEETVSMDTERKGLEAQATIADTLLVKSVKEELVEKSDSKEQSHSTTDGIVNEIHQVEAISMDSKIDELQVQGGIEDAAQQASTGVKEQPGDEISTDCQPEETTSASIKENISHESLPLKEELEKMIITEGSREAASVVETETVDTHSQNDCQETSMVDNIGSSDEISKEEEALIDEKEVLGAQTESENEIQVKIVQEELEDRSGSESHQECISTDAKMETLQSQINIANTHPVDVEITGMSDKMTADSVLENPHDKSTNECRLEENDNASQEMNSVKEGVSDKSCAGHNSMQATSADRVKEGFEDKGSAENSCQEIKPELEDKKEEKLEDKRSVKGIPDEASVPLTAKEILEVKTNSAEASCQDTQIVKDELNDETEAQLGDKSGVDSIPEEASVPAAVKEDLITQAEETNREFIKKELVGKVEEVLGESNQAEVNSTVAEKEISIPVADTDRMHPVTSVKEEIEKPDSTETEASQQITSIDQQLTEVSSGTKTDPPPVQTGKGNTGNEEISDQKTSVLDDRDKIQTKPNHSLEVSSHS